MPRPLSLTVVSVLSVLYGSLTLIPKLLFVIPSEQGAWAHQLLDAMASGGAFAVPSWLHVSHGLIGSLVWVVAGIYLWKGRGWSRWLMLGWALSVLLLTFAEYGHAGAFPLKCATFLLLLYALFNGNSSDYFRAMAPSKGG